MVAYVDQQQFYYTKMMVRRKSHLNLFPIQRAPHFIIAQHKMWMRNYRFSPCDFQCVGCLKTERWKAWACLWKRHQWTRKRIFSLFNMPSLFIFGSKFILPPIFMTSFLSIFLLSHTHTHTKRRPKIFRRCQISSTKTRLQNRAKFMRRDFD